VIIINVGTDSLGFQNSLMNRKFKRTPLFSNRNMLNVFSDQFDQCQIWCVMLTARGSLLNQNDAICWQNLSREKCRTRVWTL